LRENLKRGGEDAEVEKKNPDKSRGIFGALLIPLRGEGFWSGASHIGKHGHGDRGHRKSLRQTSARLKTDSKGIAASMLT